MLDKLFKNSLYSKHRTKLLFVLDCFIVLFSYFIAYIARMDFSLQLSSKLLDFNFYWFTFVVLGIYGVCFYFFQIYRSLWIFISIKEASQLALANITAMLCIMFGTWFVFLDTFYTSVEFMATIITILLMFSVRVSYRLYRRIVITNDKRKENVIIIGAGSAGSLLMREFSQNKDSKYRVIGFVDDVREGYVVSGVKVLGSTNDLEEIKEKYHVSLAIIAIKSLHKKEMNEIVEKCLSAKFKVKVMSDIETDSLENHNQKNRQRFVDVRIEDLLGRGEVHLEQQEISSYVVDKVVCVTGAAGSIGSELCRQIVKFNPAKLVLIDINENNLYMLEQEFSRMREHGEVSESIVVECYIASIRDKHAFNRIIADEKPSLVYHAAAHKHVPLMERTPEEAIKNNVFGTHNVIACCIENRVERFIMISTDKAVNPTNVMGATKRMTEMILQSFAKNGVTKIAAVRFGNVLGSSGSVIPIFKKQLEEGGPLTVTDKNIVRYFMTIPEASQLVLQAGYYADKGEIFVLDMGVPVKIVALAEKLISLSGLTPYKDIDIKEIGLRPGEKMFEELGYESECAIKTKNNLIYKTKVAEIKREDMEEKLSRLKGKLDCFVDISELKETLLEMISE